MMTRHFLKEGQWKACKIQQPLRKGWNFVFTGHGSAFYKCHPCHLMKPTDAAAKKRKKFDKPQRDKSKTK